MRNDSYPFKISKTKHYKSFLYLHKLQLTKLIIVIPCYNEADRLPLGDFITFLNNFKNTTILFVNDSSTDNTKTVLGKLKEQFSNQVYILNNTKNLGKAGSVREGVLYILNQNLSNQIAYLDADLATSLEECQSYSMYLEEDKKFVFASRILKIGSTVERRFIRFLTGRIIATIISSILDIKVYDTQCGCKVFDAEVAKIAFEKPFISKWLFDVELFSRLLHNYGKESALDFMEEVPVKKWVDQGDSKVKLSYFFKLWIDLYSIWRYHTSQNHV